MLPWPLSASRAARNPACGAASQLARSKSPSPRQALGGTDTAPNPVEYALAALATCQEITYRLHADALGIPLDGVSVTLEGDIDLRGFFAVDPSVRPGFRAIRGTPTLDSPASEADLAGLKAHVDAHCPVLDLLSNATPVVLELSARPADEAAA